jgi:hypothetical protein
MFVENGDRFVRSPQRVVVEHRKPTQVRTHQRLGRLAIHGVSLYGAA